MGTEIERDGMTGVRLGCWPLLLPTRRSSMIIHSLHAHTSEAEKRSGGAFASRISKSFFESLCTPRTLASLATCLHWAWKAPC